MAGVAYLPLSCRLGDPERLWSGWETYPWGVKLGLSIGLSLALYPLLLLWTDLVGLHLGRGTPGFRRLQPSFFWRGRTENHSYAS